MKTILIDLSRLKDKCGFGEIADNFSQQLILSPSNDFYFVFLVREKFKGLLGDAVGYVSLEHTDRDLKALGRTIDLWHSTDQLFVKRKHLKGMINLLTIHDLNFLHEKSGIHKWKSLLMLNWQFTRSDYITVISQYVKNDVQTHVMFDKPIKVIYNGIKDMSQVERTRPKAAAADCPFFFTIGQTRKKKNFQKLIPMMKFFPDHKLYICGKQYRKYYPELLALKNKLHADNVVFTGEITEEEKAWMYEHCEAFLFPSKLEGFGLPVLEAMRFGCKVFSSRFSSLPEICREHASYFDSMEPERMAATVREGLAHWRKTSEAALAAKTYSEGFTYEKYTSSYLALYKELLGME